MTPTPDRLGPADVLGVPTLPPARIAAAGDRARAALARLHRGMAPPPGRIVASALAGLEPAVLAALCRLEIPDRLDRPRPVAELAVDLGVDPDRLLRLLRFAHVHGWVRLDRRGRVRATRVSAFLRRDHPGGWRAWALFAASPEVSSALVALGDGLTADGDAFAAAHGRAFFDWMADHPEEHARFDGAMAAGARMHGVLLARSLPWGGRRHVCDVGGGDGTLLEVLLGHHPHLAGTVLELPEVVDRSPARHGIVALAGDAFASVPRGADTYLFVNVLHDWDDAAATTLLRRAAEALDGDRDGQVVVVEGASHPRPVDDLTLRADTLMLALTPGGRERTAGELSALGAAAGLRRVREERLVSGDVVLVLAPVG